MKHALKRNDIDVSLRLYRKHLGPPKPKADCNALASDVIDGTLDHLCNTLGESVFGIERIKCKVEKIISGGVRSSGVWCLSPQVIPDVRNVADVAEFTIMLREPYLQLMSPLQVVFDISCLFASRRLWCMYTERWSNKKLIHILAMYSGFAEACVEKCLYFDHRIVCNQHEIEVAGVEMILTPAEASYTLEAIQSMRA